MNLLKKLFGKKDGPITSYEDFWNWFQQHEKSFFKVVKQQGDIEKEFFDKLSPKLDEFKEGFFYLTGMCDDNTAELVISAEGSVKNIVFVEELVSAAPKMNSWKFTALKPALDIKDVNISMAGYEFNSKNLSFYSNELPGYPDEIDITVVHKDLDEENKKTIINGSYVFLDNYLGELDFVTTIDNLNFIGNGEVQAELIPIEKLKSFLIWRQKEFVEKYEGVMQNTENANYSLLEAELKTGNKLIAVINTDILNWEKKASHPWILSVEMKYDGENSNGMPDEQTHELLEEIENKILEDLKDVEGYLNIGRQTADSTREIYFACKEFRKPSKLLHEIQCHYSCTIKINFDIYKDKYWRSFNRFNNN